MVVGSRWQTVAYTLAKAFMWLATHCFSVATAMGKETIVYDVRNVEKVVEPNYKVHVPKEFWSFLEVGAGSVVVVSLFEQFNEIRIRKKRG